MLVGTRNRHHSLVCGSSAYLALLIRRFIDFMWLGGLNTIRWNLYSMKWSTLQKILLRARYYTMRNEKSERKGVTYSITILLLVALAIAMATGFAAYVIGVMGGIGGSAERLVVYGDSLLIVDQAKNRVCAIVRVYADIKPSITIKYMVIGTAQSTNVRILEVLQGDPYVVNGELVLPAGSYVVIQYDFPGSLASTISPEYWGTVEGRMISDQGYLYKVPLKLKYDVCP